MTIWAEREFEAGAWSGTQDAFEAAFTAAGAPEDMMLICVNGETRRTQKLIASLPNEAQLSVVPGFTAITEDKLPKVAALLVGHNLAFEQRFDYGVA